MQLQKGRVAAMRLFVELLWPFVVLLVDANQLCIQLLLKALGTSGVETRLNFAC